MDKFERRIEIINEITVLLLADFMVAFTDFAESP